MACQESKESKKKTGKASDFNWTDDEVQLLLEAVYDFKAECDYEGVSWESKRTKYEQIKEKFCEQYPNVEDDSYPRGKNVDVITKDRVAAKLKTIRANFKKSVDTGKRSGGGRIIFTFYDLCEKIWGGCPAVRSIAKGIDTSTRKGKTHENEDDESVGSVHTELNGVEVEVNDESHSPQSSSLVSRSVSCENEAGLGRESEDEEEDAQNIREKTTQRRKKVEEGLKNRRDKKLSSKLSTDTQLLNISKEELSLKRKLVEQLQTSEEEFNSGMNKVFKSMETISSCIQQTVGILGQLVNQQQPSYPQYAHPFNQPSFNNLPSPQFGHPSQRSENHTSNENDSVQRYDDRTYYNLQ